MIIDELINKIYNEHKCNNTTCYCSFLIICGDKRLYYPISFISLFKINIVRHLYCLLNNKEWFLVNEQDFNGNECNYIIPKNLVLKIDML